MLIIDNNDNAERILTIVESLTKTNKEYRNLKEISKTVHKYIEKELKTEIKSYGFIRYYIEKAIVNSKSKYFSILDKEIILANILLPDDIKIAELLNNNGFTIEHLKTIIRFRGIIKNNLLNNITFNIQTQEQFNVYKKYVTKITQLFSTEFHIHDQTIILNRICEMLITCPLYFESKTIQNIKIR